MNRRQHDVFAELSSGSSGGVWAGQDHSSWSVPWADLMMVMFVLFAVLYVFKATNRDVKVIFSGNASRGAASSTTASVDPLQGLIGRLSGHMNAVGESTATVALDGTESVYRSERSEVAVTRGADNAVRIALRGAVMFPSGDQALDDPARGYLVQVADFLRKTPGTVHVVGFAAEDEAAGMESFRLSADRARAVASYLAGQGIEPGRFVISGRGAYEPEVPSSLDGGQQRNRRVKLYILPGQTEGRSVDTVPRGELSIGAQTR